MKRKVNKLNDLSGKDWIKFTKSWVVCDENGNKKNDYNTPSNRKISDKSWFIHVPPPRENSKILHPASFPETLAKEFIEFFTKKNEWVLDPFLGSGSTLIACYNCKRNGIGIELSPYWAEISEKRLKEIKNQTLIDKYCGEEETQQIIIQGDARDIDKIWRDNNLPRIDYVLTSPPYWNQLKRNYLRQKERVKKELPTTYSENPKDLGNIDDYASFLKEQKLIFDKIYEIVKDGGYLTIITNNIYADERVYPLAFDTFLSLSEKWVPKDEKLWLQDDKPLLPLGIYSTYVGNRHHQYCLIFRKEKRKIKEQKSIFVRIINMFEEVSQNDCNQS